MNRLASFFAAVVVACSGFVAVPAQPATANVFCPVTIATLVDLSIVGMQDVYGILLDFDPGDTQAVRVRIDSPRTRYAVDYNDIETVGGRSLQVMRYFQMPMGERVVAAFVESTGASPGTRTPCPITRPYAADAPEPQGAGAVEARDRARREIRDHFSTRTQVMKPQPFGATANRSCQQPFAPAHAIVPVQAPTPPEARAVRATGTVTLRVDLDEESRVVDAAVTHSSGFAPLDRAALEAAKRATYRTETFDCRAIASSYSFQVPFN